MTASRLVVVSASVVDVGLRLSGRTARRALGRHCFVNKIDIPFQFEVVGNGPEPQASFFDGDLKVTSTSGQREENNSGSPSTSMESV